MDPGWPGVELPFQVLTLEPWNNVAERAVRTTKAKVSGGITTLTGLKTFPAVRGYLDDALNAHA